MENKKDIQLRNYWWILVVVSILLVLWGGSNLLKTDEQKFHDLRKSIENVDSSVLLRTKEVCLSALEESNKHMFIYVSCNSGSYVCQLHTLTIEGEYVIYDIVSDNYKDELPYFLYTGKPSAISIYSSEYKELDDYLYIAKAKLNGKVITIF